MNFLLACEHDVLSENLTKKEEVSAPGTVGNVCRP
jgi:hypothetical protein